MALSKESDISRIERTTQMKKTDSMPESVPVIPQPSHAPSASPITVKMRGQIR